MPRNRGKFGALFKKVFIAGLVTRAAKLLLLAGVCFVLIINEVYSSKDLFVTESNMNCPYFDQTASGHETIVYNSHSGSSEEVTWSVKQKVPSVLKCLIDFQWCFVERGRTT